MKPTNNIQLSGLILFLVLFSGGCSHADIKKDYLLPSSGEAEWIRNGEPIEFEGEPWFPQDDIEILLDSEVHAVGESRGVEFFIDQADVKPYQRLYTKFGRNKFRAFERKTNHDQGL